MYCTVLYSTAFGHQGEIGRNIPYCPRWSTLAARQFRVDAVLNDASDRCGTLALALA